MIFCTPAIDSLSRCGTIKADTERKNIMSRLGIIDTHAHLDDNRFDADREQVLDRLSRDMEAVITQGTTYETSVASVRLAEQYDFLYAAVGWHPEDLAGITGDAWLADLERLAREHEKSWPSGKSAWIIIGRKTNPARYSSGASASSANWPWPWTCPSCSTTGTPTATP